LLSNDEHIGPSTGWSSGQVLDLGSTALGPVRLAGRDTQPGAFCGSGLFPSSSRDLMEGAEALPRPVSNAVQGG